MLGLGLFPNTLVNPSASGISVPALAAVSLWAIFSLFRNVHPVTLSGNQPTSPSFLLSPQFYYFYSTWKQYWRTVCIGESEERVYHRRQNPCSSSMGTYLRLADPGRHGRINLPCRIRMGQKKYLLLENRHIIENFKWMSNGLE